MGSAGGALGRERCRGALRSCRPAPHTSDRLGTQVPAKGSRSVRGSESSIYPRSCPRHCVPSLTPGPVSCTACCSQCCGKGYGECDGDLRLRVAKEARATTLRQVRFAGRQPASRLHFWHAAATHGGRRRSPFSVTIDPSSPRSRAESGAIPTHSGYFQEAGGEPRRGEGPLARLLHPSRVFSPLAQRKDTA